LIPSKGSNDNLNINQELVLRPGFESGSRAQDATNEDLITRFKSANF